MPDTPGRDAYLAKYGKKKKPKRTFNPSPTPAPRPLAPSLVDKAAAASIFLPPALTAQQPAKKPYSFAAKAKPVAPGTIARERRGLSLGVGADDKEKWARQPQNDLRAVPKKRPTRFTLKPSASFTPDKDILGRTAGGFVRSVGNASADFAKGVARRIALASVMPEGRGILKSREAQAASGIGKGMAEASRVASENLVGPNLTHAIMGEKANPYMAGLEGAAMLPFLRGPAALTKAIRAGMRGEKVGEEFARAYETSTPILSAARAARGGYGRRSARDLKRLGNARIFNVGEGDNVLPVIVPGASSKAGRLGERIFDAARPLTSKTRLVKSEEAKAGVEMRQHVRIRNTLMNVPGQALAHSLRGLDDDQVYALRVAGERIPPEERAAKHREWARVAEHPEEAVYHAAHAALAEDAAKYIEIAPDGLATLSPTAPRKMQEAWAHLNDVSLSREDIIRDLGLLSDETMANRALQVGRVYRDAEYQTYDEIIRANLENHRGRKALFEAFDQIHADDPLLAQAHKSLHDARARRLAEARGVPENIDLYYGPMQTEFHLDRFVPREVIEGDDELRILLQNVDPLPMENLPERLDMNALLAAVEGKPLPKGMQTPEGLREALERVYSYTREGQQYRHWYDVAAKNVAEFADILEIPRDRASMVLAVYSQQAMPTENLRRAMIAMLEWKDTGKVKFSPFAKQGEKAQQILDGVGDWKGIKTSSYHANILEGIDPALYRERYGDTPIVTNDRWVAEIFDPGLEKSIPPAIYDTLRDIYVEMGRQLGWKPKEVQAASWVIAKARGQAERMAKRFGKDPDAYERYIESSADAYGRALDKYFPDRPEWVDTLMQTDQPIVNRPVRVISAADAETMEPRAGFWYHGTSPQAEEAIMQQGVMRPGSRAPEAVWFVSDPKQAAFWGDRIFEVPDAMIPKDAETMNRFGMKWRGVTHDLPIREDIPHGPQTSSIDFEFTDGVSGLGNDLTLAQKQQLQVAMEKEVFRLARSVPGVKVRGIEHGVGGWAGGVNADFHLVVDGIPEAKDELASKIGQAFDQELVQVSRTTHEPGDDTAAALVLISPAFRDDAQKLAFFQRLNQAAPEFEGFMPGYRFGQPAIISRTAFPAAGPEFEQQYAGIVKRIADEMGIPVTPSSENLELRISSQAGRVDRMSGRGEVGGVEHLTGDVREARRRLEREIAKIRDPENQMVKAMSKAEAYGAEPDPRFVFHGTSDPGAASALEQGHLQPGGPLGGAGDVAWTANDPYLAATHAGKASYAAGDNEGGTVLRIPRDALPEGTVEHGGQNVGKTDQTTFASPERILLDTVGGEGGEARGLIIFSQDGKASIHFSESSDASTIEHELAHYMRREMEGTPHEADVAHWAGAKWDGKAKRYVWDRRAEEKYANAVVAFHRSGRGPSVVRNEMKRVSAALREDFRLKDLPDLPPNVAESIGRLLSYSKPKGGRMVGGEDFILQADLMPIYIGAQRGVPLTLKDAARNTKAYMAKAGSLFGGGRKQAIGAGPQDAHLRKAFKGHLYRSGMFKRDLRAPTEQLMVAVRMSEAHRVRKMLLQGSSEVPRNVSDIAIKVDPKKTTSPRLAALADRLETLEATGNKLDEKDLDGIDIDLIEGMKHDLFPGEVDGVPIETIALKALQSNEPIPNLRWVSREFMEEADLLGKPGGRPSDLAGAPRALARGAGASLQAVNDVQKAMLLYLNPGYGPMQMFGNGLMNLIQQGAFMPVRLFQAATMHKALSPTARMAVDMLMGTTGTEALSMASTPGQVLNRSLGHWISQAVDTIPRRASFFHEAARVGIKDSELERLLVDAVKGHEEASQIVDTLTRRAQDAIGPFDRLSPFEKQYVAPYIFFYPWLKAATRYSGRFVLEHPLQAAGLALAAEYAWGDADEKLGNRPAFAKDTFVVGTDAIGLKVPGTGIKMGLSDLVGHHNWESQGYPMTVSARQMFTMTTPLDIARMGIGFATSDPTADSPLENLTPAWYAGIVATIGYDPFLRKEVERGPRTFLSQVTNLPALDRYKKIAMSDEDRADKNERSLYPRSKGQEIARMFGGSLTPSPYNPVVGEDMAHEGEKASPEQRLVNKTQTIMEDLDTVAKAAKVPVPPVIRQQAEMLARLDANPKRLEDGRHYDYEERLATIIDLYAERFPDDAARIRKESAGAKGDVAKEWYLDIREEMFGDYRQFMNEYDQDES